MKIFQTLAQRLFDSEARRADRIGHAIVAHNNVTAAFSTTTEPASVHAQMSASARAIRWAGKVSADHPQLALAMLTHVTVATTKTPHIHSPQMESVRGMALHNILELAPLLRAQYPTETTSALAVARHAATPGSALRRRAVALLDNSPNA